MSGVDSEVDEKEKQLLDKAAALLGLSPARKTELELIARDLEPLDRTGGSWTKEIVALFKAIPQRLEGDGEYEVAFA